MLGPRSHMAYFMKSCKMLLLLQIVWYHIVTFFTIELLYGYLRVVQEFWSHMAHSRPIWCKYAECISSYRLHGTMLKLCHNSTVVWVPLGWGVQEFEAHGPFCEIAQNDSSPTNCMVHCWGFVMICFASAHFGVFRNFRPKVPHGLFYEIMQIASSPTDCMVQC